MKKINKIELSLALGFIITVMFASILSFAQSYENITDGVFRLHILANSDSESDQALKLKVRDEILAKTSNIFEKSGNAKEAAAKAEKGLAEIEWIARNVIAENGYDYDVSCEVKEVYFPQRTYGNVTLPAGVYNALRVNIGKAEGQNWWCVMFPPLCIPAAVPDDDGVSVKDDDINFKDDDIFCGAFTEQEIAMMQQPEKYEVRFYFADMYNKLTGKDKK